MFKKRFINYIRLLDIFGYPVGLNFEKKGETHKTFIGGIASLFVNMCILIYTILMVKKLIFLEGDTILQDIERFVFEETNFKDTNLTLFLSVAKQDNVHHQQEALRYDDYAKEHIHMQFVHVNYNINQKEISEEDFVVFDVKDCDRELDFGQNEKSKEIFDSFDPEQYTLICPDEASRDTFSLYGNKNTQTVKSLEFQIFRCDAYRDNIDEERKCASKEEIDHFVHDIEVTGIVVQEQIDFLNKYYGKPTDVVQDELFSVLLNN